METMFGFAALVMTTILGLFAALALQALALRLALCLMQPATVDRRPVRPSRPAIERGTQFAARAYRRTN